MVLHYGMVAYLGLPLSLEKVGKVLGLEKQKLSEGKNLLDISVCLVNQPRLTVKEEEIFQSMKDLSGRNLKNITSEM